MPTFRIRESLDVYAPRQAAGALAKQLGFRSSECAELAIVVSELCSNIVKYGIRGSIALEPIEDPVHGLGLAIVAYDVGPPFHDFSTALQDGCDDRGPIDPCALMRRGGLGIGLGAVARLSHSLNVETASDGKYIRVVRYVTAPRGKRS
jgi:anti-sigma regulatory factor (Ser/Thr protein kinase)